MTPFNDYHEHAQNNSPQHHAEFHDQASKKATAMMHHLASKGAPPALFQEWGKAAVYHSKMATAHQFKDLANQAKLNGDHALQLKYAGLLEKAHQEALKMAPNHEITESWDKHAQYL